MRLAAGLSLAFMLCAAAGAQIIIDHQCTDITQIPQAAIEQAKSTLHIAYGHTSHGSQLTDGMTGLVGFMNGKGYPEDLYAWNNGGSDGALDLRDYYGDFPGGASDLGNPNRTQWATATADYLDNPANADVNVIIWSWCGQADTTEANINLYLTQMDALEDAYPDVTFVYMTGHTAGSGLEGNLHLRNQQIRDYCAANGKTLYDFEDIESYDPDGNYFGDKYVSDDCSYTGGNWATEWQAAHTENTDWYDCGSAHSEPLNANQKAYAAWWLWARLAGWAGPDTGDHAADVDDSGDVDAVDVQTVINKALSIVTGVDCDINDDGEVDAVDVQLVVNAALGLW